MVNQKIGLHNGRNGGKKGKKLRHNDSRKGKAIELEMIRVNKEILETKFYGRFYYSVTEGSRKKSSSLNGRAIKILMVGPLRGGGYRAGPLRKKEFF